MKIRSLCHICLIASAVNLLPAAPLPHPIIWVTPQERVATLAKIEHFGWAASIAAQLHQHVDAAKDRHRTDPAATLAMIPELGGHMVEHNAVLNLAMESGVLYFLTKDEAYAQLSADVFAAYAAKLAHQTPTTTAIMGDPFMDGRTTYPLLALAYDFIYPFIKQPGTTVYDSRTQQRRAFDNAEAQATLRNIAGNIVQEYSGPDVHGSVVSNHCILTAPGALYPILCIEDETERERLFTLFWEVGTHHQPSFKHTIIPLYSAQGIWPESLSYSFMTNVLMVLNIIDRIKPDLGAIEPAHKIMNGTFIYPNLKNPDGTYIRYGDSKRNNDGSGELYRLIINIATRRGFADLKQKAEIVLKKQLEDEGGYKPGMKNPLYDNDRPLALFWGSNIDDSITGKIDYKPTVIVQHAGVALQRNFVEKDNLLYGLTGYIGGATYVHSHLTGIAMELYGAGYVMAPNAGLPPSVKERQLPLHEHYFRLYAGNNTMIVNGTSHGLQQGSWKERSNLWQNTTVNIAAEPGHLEDPISKNFSFATQFLKDTVNHCDQERTLSILRTSPTTGYYFDLFRSRSLDENRFHDYIYHNLGDETHITNDRGEALPLTVTDRYDNDIGDVVHSPGWRYFENEQVTAPTDRGVKVQFNLNFNHCSMHLFVPGGVMREYTLALGPPTREANNGYVDKKTQILAIRQQGEAWNRPYVAIFEPSVNLTCSVRSVTQLAEDGRIVGTRVVSQIGPRTVTDYILCHDSDTGVFTSDALKMRFTGRFGVVRKEEADGATTISLYIGRGKALSFEGHSLTADPQGRGFKTIGAN
jgi:hypothetical protein